MSHPSLNGPFESIIKLKIATDPQADRRTDSRDLARSMGVKHMIVLGLVEEHSLQFAKMGVFRFEVDKTRHGLFCEDYVLLNEDQANLLVMLMPNTEATCAAKARMSEMVSGWVAVVGNVQEAQRA